MNCYIRLLFNKLIYFWFPSALIIWNIIYFTSLVLKNLDWTWLLNNRHNSNVEVIFQYDIEIINILKSSN